MSRTISNNGQVLSIANEGAGTGLYDDTVNSIALFKTLTSTGGDITITNNATTVNLEVGGGGPVPVGTEGQLISYDNTGTPYAGFTFVANDNTYVFTNGNFVLDRTDNKDVIIALGRDPVAGSASLMYGDYPATLYWTLQMLSAPDLTLYLNQGSGATNENFVMNLGTGALSITGRIFNSDGSTPSPTYSFASDTNSGLYLHAADQPAISAGGNRIASFGVGGLTVNTGVLSVPDGSATSPSVTFINDNNTGLFRVGAEQLGITAQGNLVVQVDTAGLRLANGVFKANNGSSVAPVYSFDADTDTGMYRPGADQLGFVVNGTDSLVLGNTFNINLLPFLNTAGTVTNPAYSFQGDTNTGLYNSGTDAISVTCNGVQQFSFNTGGVVLNNGVMLAPTGSTTAPSYSFSGDSNSGFYRVGADNVGIAVNGVTRFRVTTSGAISAGPQLHINSGSAATPAIAFDSDTDTGIYQSAGSQLQFSVDNSERLRLTASQPVMAGIHGATSSGGIAVLINASGQLGTTTSSMKYKEKIDYDLEEEMSKISQLKPCKFKYKREACESEEDYNSQPTQYGLIAEELQEIWPNMVVNDSEGHPQTIRYHLFISILLAKIQQLEMRISELENIL